MVLLALYAPTPAESEVAVAYSNVTQYAIVQENFEQAVIFRALSVSKDMERSGDIMNILQQLPSLSFMNEFASDLYRGIRRK